MDPDERACDEWNARFFVNDRENPYANDPDKPFIWIRGRHVGGRSLMWGRQVYRWSDLDFEANAREGIAVDWPIRYADIAPWYDHVERFIGVSGQAEGLAHLPDGQFLPPMELNCAERAMREAVSARWKRRAAADDRAVRHPHPAPQRPRGVPLLRSLLAGLHHPFLLQQHRLHPAGRTSAPAASPSGRTAWWRACCTTSGATAPPASASSMRNTRQVLEFRARVVFLCASALESTRILLN